MMPSMWQKMVGGVGNLIADSVPKHMSLSKEWALALAIMGVAYAIMHLAERIGERDH